ncbi:MAG: sigma 54-interacting transcriptional regulator [Zoogloeaceae bacterium]|jgi:transcriptional regulator with PAS, ATPase and Fis domain|nr:sigma 54-interacting transcriptional regulator [Zoogloeaceae bacterium]
MKFAAPHPSPVAAPKITDFEELYVDERWRVLGDLIPDGLIMVNRSGLVSYMNSAAESINEVYRLTVIGHSLEDLVQQSRIDCSGLLEAFEHGSRINKIVCDANGRAYLLSTRSYRWWSGESSDFMIVLRNLDALEKIARRLYEGEGETSLRFMPLAAARLPILSDGVIPLAAGAPNFTSAPADDAPAGADELIVSGASTTAIVERGLRAIAMNIRLLILGESGVGKTELARLLHRRSGPAVRPFVHVNCGAIPDTLFESEMFGYERGAFTGASSKGKKGLIEAAEGGILFLDEVGEIPLHCQAKILQVLEEGVIQRVGATASRRLRLQVIAATNRDLLTLVEEGRFRRDLYYRLSVVTLLLPPLRERRELIPLLADRFLANVNQRRKTPLTIDADCRRRLQEYAYPGNVRELQNIVEYLGVVSDRIASEADLPREQMATLPAAEVLSGAAAALSAPTRAVPTFPAGFSLREAVRNYESALIDAAIQKTGSKRKAAELLGVDIATVVRKSKTADSQPPLESS